MEMKEIAEEIRTCMECRKNKKGLAVVGEGPQRAKVMFVGMAPGIEESKTGRPFVGRSGKILTGMLASIGMERKHVYLTSPVKYYPGRRNLKKNEIEHGTLHLKKQIESTSPKLIVLLGEVAVKALLPEMDLKVTKAHGSIIRKEGREYFITFHPSAAMRFPKIMKLMLSDFKKLRTILP